MKRFFTLILILLISPSAIAEDEFATQELLETQQINEVEFKEISPLQKVLQTEIKQTDVPSYLLKEQLTFNYENGPISQTQFYGAYRGSITGILSSHDYTTKYNNNAVEFGALGKFHDKDYGFKLMVRPIPVEGLSYMDNFLGDIYIESSKIPHHKIVTGFQRVQKGMEGGEGQYTLPLYARSQISRNFGNTRSLTAKIIGNYNYADYSISFGSSSPYLVRGFPGTEFVSWINVKPFGSSDGKFGKLTLGGGFSAGHNGITYTNGNVYAGYKHKKFSTNFEAAIADGYSGSQGVSANKAGGFAYTIGWDFNPKLQIIGRIDQFDPNRDKRGNLKREYTAGLNWFIKGQALRLIMNYVYCQNQNAKDSHKFIVGTQVLL